MPSVITFDAGNSITYTYAADGTKLRTVHKTGATTVTTDYCGNVIYENGVAKQLLTEEGYVSLNDGQYHYYLKDHQGNNRVIINSSGKPEETNHYYPFGGVFASTGNVQPYKYNGKEYDSKKGLNWYDYGAGYVAGKTGLSWSTARMGFDTLESYQNSKLSTEGKPTQRAERLGYDAGSKQYPLRKASNWIKQLFK